MLVLTNSQAITGSASTAKTLNAGFQGVLSVDAGTYPGGLDIQYQGYNGSWIRMNTSNIAANAVMPFRFPAGQYRMNVNSGTVQGLSAVLLPTP